MNDSPLFALQALQLDQRVLAHVSMNLANALTPGYKRLGTMARMGSPVFAPLVQDPAAQSAMHAATTASAVAPAEPAMDTGRSYIDLRAGTLKTTGRTLDLALAGTGFFEVRTSAGPAYTRQGNFSLDGRGRLVTAQGNAVMGTGGEIVLDSAAVRIDDSGNIFASESMDGSAASAGLFGGTGEAGSLSGASGAGGIGSSSGTGSASTPLRPFSASAAHALGSQGAQSSAAPLAQLKVVGFSRPQALSATGSGLFSSTEEPQAMESTGVGLRQGFLENANTDSLQEMLAMMAALRHAETMVRVLQGYDDMLGNTIRSLGNPA